MGGKRVTVTLPVELVEDIDRFERNRSRSDECMAAQGVESARCTFPGPHAQRSRQPKHLCFKM